MHVTCKSFAGLSPCLNSEPQARLSADRNLFKAMPFAPKMVNILHFNPLIYKFSNSLIPSPLVAFF